MRLPLIALAVVPLGAGCSSAVTHDASARCHLLADERLSVVSPSAREELSAGDSRVSVDYTVDVVSGATQALTVDAVSTATTFSEIRHQGSVAVARTFGGGTDVGAAYTLGYEPDHTVHAPSVGLARRSADAQTEAWLRYEVDVESTGRADLPAFAERAIGHRLDVGSTRIATKRLVVTALATLTSFECSAALGCFANPYRYVAIETGSAPLAVAERNPPDRFSAAGALRLGWAFGRSTALHAGYRFGQDTWGIGAHTVDTALAGELLGKRLLLRTEGRATFQGGARFYRSRYAASEDALPAFRTADAELSPLWNARLQLHAEWTLAGFQLVGELGRMWSGYPYFPSLPLRRAWLAGIGVDARF